MYNVCVYYCDMGICMWYITVIYMYVVYYCNMYVCMRYIIVICVYVCGILL